jgi:DNA repair protein RadD
MELRYYQQECINAVYSELMSGVKRFYVHLPTGSGKTIVFVKLIESLLSEYENFRCVFVVPKIVLIDQTVDKFSNPDLVGVYNATKKSWDLNKPITVASIQSLSRVIDLQEINLLVIDECHRLHQKHRDILQRYENIRPTVKCLGLTATSFDIDEMFWEKKVYSKTMLELTQQGYLCPIINSDTSGAQFDLTGMNVTSRGDFLDKELKERINKDKVRDQVQDTLKRAINRNKILYLTVSIEHAELVNDLLDELGENSEILHSKMPLAAQEKALNNFKTIGRHLVSVLIISEGFDYPEADCLSFMRPTRSPTLYVQGAGRVARNAPGKSTALLLDYGGITLSLGDVYSAAPMPDRRKKTIKSDFKVCSSCEIFNKSKNKRCSQCGEKFLLMCDNCLKPFPYGEYCCDQARQKFDPLQNLTTKAYKGGLELGVEHKRKISHCIFKYFKRKDSNNYGLLIIFYDVDGKSYPISLNPVQDCKYTDFGFMAFKSRMESFDIWHILSAWIKNPFHATKENIERVICDLKKYAEIPQFISIISSNGIHWNVGWEKGNPLEVKPTLTIGGVR